MFCRYSPLLYRFKTLSSWAAVSSIPQWSSPLKAEEKNYLDEEHSAQDKTKFHLNEALSMGALWCPAPGMWCGQEIPELLQVRFHTWHNPGIPAQNPKSAGTKHWGEPPQEININQYREFQSCACSLAIAHHHLFSLLMHTGAKNCKTSKSGLQATTHLKATALVISEDLWKGHLSLWLLRYKKTLVSLKMRKYPGFYH